VEYKLVTERIHLYCPNVHVCFAAELTRAFESAAVRAAVGKALERYPVLRSHVRTDGAGSAYLRLDAQAGPELHTMQGDIGGWPEIVLREQEKPFDLFRGPLLRFTYLTGGNGAMLIVCLHHILADGISGVKLLRCIARFLSEPGLEPEPVPGGLLEDAVLYPGEKLPLPVGLLAGWLNGRWRKGRHVFGAQEYQTMLENYSRQKSHTLRTAWLGQAPTEKLAATCRENGVTVNSLLTATLLKAVQEVCGRTKKTKSAGIAAGIHPSETSIGNFATAVSVVHAYDGGKSVWENTRILQEQVRKKLGNQRRKLFYLTFLKALEPNLIDSMYFSLFGGFGNSTSALLAKLLGYVREPDGGGVTNLGISGLTARGGVRALYFVPPLVPSTDRIAGAVTTDTGLRLVYQYDDRNGGPNARIFESWIEMLQKL
jgi:hypothetical protein